jgi:hypothetical protein
LLELRRPNLAGAAGQLADKVGKEVGDREKPSLARTGTDDMSLAAPRGDERILGRIGERVGTSSGASSPLSGRKLCEEQRATMVGGPCRRCKGTT